MKTVLLHAHTHIHTAYSLMDYTINKWGFFHGTNSIQIQFSESWAGRNLFEIVS